MFLTPPSPSRTKFFAKFSNATSPHSKPAAPQSYLPRTGNLPPLQISAPHNPNTAPSTAADMATSHRGLEQRLPPGTILPDPLGAPSIHGQIREPGHGTQERRSSTAYRGDDYPAPSQSWQQPQMRQSERLHTEDGKIRQEELKQRQEELKVRQEEIKLDQRKLEHEMLRDAIAKGIHPNLVPLIFLGLGAAASGSPGGFEMAQQYIQHFQQVGAQVQSQLPYSPPETRRIFAANPAGPVQYGAIQQTSQSNVPPLSAPTGLPPAPLPPPPSAAQGHTAAAVAALYPSPAFQSPRTHARSVAPQSARLTSAAPLTEKLPPSSALPRLTTNEAQVSVGAPGNAGSSHVPPPGTGDRTSPSPSLYFHHWQPPATTASISQKTSPKHSNVSSSEIHHASPRKRKATGPHQPAPPPSSYQHSVNRSISPARSTTSIGSKRRGRRRSSVASTTQPGGREMSRQPSKERAPDSGSYEARAEASRAQSSQMSSGETLREPSSARVQSSSAAEMTPSRDS